MLFRCLTGALAACALALPATAPADVVVHPATTVEGDSGLTRAVTTIDLRCVHPERLNNARCTYELYFTAGSALGFQDFVWDPPRRLEVFAPGGGEHVETLTMAVDVVGDKKVEGDEDYGIVVVEKVYDPSDPAAPAPETSLRELNEGTSTAGTIVDDDEERDEFEPARERRPGDAPATVVTSDGPVDDGLGSVQDAPTTAVAPSLGDSGSPAADGTQTLDEARRSGPCFMGCG